MEHAFLCCSLTCVTINVALIFCHATLHMVTSFQIRGGRDSYHHTVLLFCIIFFKWILVDICSSKQKCLNSFGLVISISLLMSEIFGLVLVKLFSGDIFSCQFAVQLLFWTFWVNLFHVTKFLNENNHIAK